MKMTNLKGLPQPLVDAIAYDTYKVHGDLSCTSMIDSPQVRVLKKRFSREIETDVSEQLWAIMGTMVHSILERSHIKDVKKQAFLTVIESIKEESVKYNEADQRSLQLLIDNIIKLMVKMFPEIDGRYIYETALVYEYGGLILYGTFDLYDKWENHLYDYKVCSVYAYLYPESRRKWTAQTNTYAFLLRNKGYKIDKISIVAIFRDWSAAKKITNPDYPSEQFMTIPIVVVDHLKMEKWVNARIELHIKAEQGEVPPCSGEDMWRSANEYVAKTPGIKKAIRKFPNEEACDDWIKINKVSYEKGLSKFIRVGEAKRCESYCPVRAFCPQKAKDDADREKYLDSGGRL